MNAILFTTNDPIYMPQYLAPILEQKHDVIEEVILAPRSEPAMKTIKRRYAMFGLYAFVQFGIRYAVGKTKNKLVTSLSPVRFDRYHSVQTLATDYDIPVRTVDDINSDSFIDEVGRAEPDLFLSIACEQIFGEELLSIPEDGCINIHGSLLPNYRGVATSFWAMYHNESKHGVTAHYMTPDLDAGEIIKQYEYEIDEDDTMHDVYIKLTKTGAELAIDVLQDVDNDRITTKPNPVEDGEYFSYPSAEDRKEFLRRGNRFI